MTGRAREAALTMTKLQSMPLLLASHVLKALVTFAC